MKAVVTYESLYGNTAEVARAIGEGLATLGAVVVVPASDNVHHELEDADLLVVGGPTHVHGMSTHLSRRSAFEAATTSGEELHLEGEAIRTLLHDLGEGHGRSAAAFDTRAHGPKILTGSAAAGIGRRLRRHGFDLLAEPESFVVSESGGPLADGERDRAVGWGAALATKLAAHRTAGAAS